MAGHRFRSHGWMAERSDAPANADWGIATLCRQPSIETIYVPAYGLRLTY